MNDQAEAKEPCTCDNRVWQQGYSCCWEKDLRKKIANETKDKIFEALGEVSMCWSEVPAGVFDVKSALRIGDSLVDYILNGSDAHPVLDFSPPENELNAITREQ